MRILAVLDGSEGTGRVVKYLLELCAINPAIEVVLLNIEPKPRVWRTRGYESRQREAGQDRISDRGKRVVASAARHLDEAGITHQDRIEPGDPGEAILRCAHAEKCR